MSTRPTIDGPSIRIALAGTLAAKLFGLPFLLVGAYMAYQLAGGIADIASGRAAMTEMLAGTIVLVIFTAAFLIPGWLLVFSSARVEIDRAARSVTSIRDFRIYQQRTVRPLTEFTRLEVDHLSVSSSRQSKGKASYQVELAGDHRKNVVVGLFDDDEEAVTFAREVGGVLDLPVDDRRNVERDSDE